jgi:hypothetical protein
MIGEKVELTKWELNFAAQVGLTRRIESMTNSNVSPKYGKKPDETLWGIDIEAACAEMAVAKCLNVHWDCSVNRYGKNDCGDVMEFQVKHTIGEDNSLLVRDNAKDDEIFILVCGQAPKFRVAGWLRGKEIKLEKYVRAPAGRPPAYFVPQSDLKRPERLKDMIVQKECRKIIERSKKPEPVKVEV